MSKRLFVALRPPEEQCDALLDLMEGVDAARWQDSDNLHLTLRFIGFVDERLAEDIDLALMSVRARPFPLQIKGIGHFERKGQGKAIWADIDASQALDNLQNAVEMACRRAGLDAETRKFCPHITLARLNSSSGDFAGWMTRHASFALPTWEVREVVLYESELTDSGAYYEALARYPLSP